MEKKPISYQIIRSARKTLALEIRPDGTVLVRAPQRLSDRKVREFITAREDWLRAHLKKYENRPSLPRLTGQELQALAEQAKRELKARADFFAPQVGVTFGRITIRAQRTRWGSCSSQGNLNFNCLLMLAPEAVRDYVVVHELCHRKEMNHSARFWAEVERILPDYRARRQWLTDNGASLLARLPE